MSPQPVILLVTDHAADGKRIVARLSGEYSTITLSTDPREWVRDFEVIRPALLILAFRSVEKAERYCRELFRQGVRGATHPHQTLVLCQQAELPEVYTLCKRGFFDDFAIYWPKPQEALRLPMAIHNCLRRNTRLTMIPVPPIQTLAQGWTERTELHAEDLPVGSAPTTVPVPVLSRQTPEIILLVDDDGLQFHQITLALAQSSYEVIYAASGIEALTILHKRRPDLILMDINLPGSNGISLTRRIKAIPNYSTIPIVMVTGESEGNVVEECLDAGAVDFLVKPIQKATLVAKLHAVLEGVRHGGEVPSDFGDSRIQRSEFGSALPSN